MTEQQKPLSRRERRLREMAESGVIELEQEQLAAGAAGQEPSAAELEEAQLTERLLAEIEISPVNEDGSPRTRREMRMLRDAALQEALAAYRAEHPAASGAEPAADTADELAEGTPTVAFSLADLREAETPRVETVAEQTAAEAPAAGPTAAAQDDAEEPAADAAEMAADSQDDADDALPPTAAFSLDELLEAESVAAVNDLTAPKADPLEELFGVAADESAVSQGEQAAEVAEAESAEVAAAEDAAATESAEQVTDLPAAPEVDAAADLPVVAEPAEEPGDAEQQVESGAESAQEEEPQEAKKTEYSFPDIEPLADSISVFDADSPHRSAASAPGAFDALLERAVADEGTGGGTSVPTAVILPAAPEDTGLVGPLNETGELFITGSLRLPKSLSETGGHARLHDSVQYDEPLVQEENAAAVNDLLAAAEEGPVPVSARNAVSAQSESGLAGLAKPAKESSRKPLVLGLVGGGLVVVVAGVTVIVMRVLGG